MRKKILLLLLVLSIIGLGSLAGQEKGKTQNVFVSGIQMKAGLVASYNSAKIKVGTSEVENTLNFFTVGLQLDAELTDWLTVAASVGYAGNKFTDSLLFNQLPLSLQFESKQNNSMFFGVSGKSVFDVYNDFSVQPRAEFLYFKKLKVESPVVLPIVQGTATLENSFTQITLEVLGQYDGFSGVSVFLGPQLNFISGKLKATETIQQISGEEKMTYKQKSPFGVAAGATFEISDNFVIDLRAGILCKNSATVSVMYAF